VCVSVCVHARVWYVYVYVVWCGMCVCMGVGVWVCGGGWHMRECMRVGGWVVWYKEKVANN